jgi:diguanylate cyclase (GGDEF)-like protein
MKSVQIDSPSKTAFHKIQAVLDRSFAFLSRYGIPAAIGLISLLSLLAWNDRYDASPEKRIEFHALIQTGEEQSLQTIAEALAETPLIRHFDTHLSQRPVWFTFGLQEVVRPLVVEFPSRHAVGVTCWDASTQVKLGQASGRAHEGQIEPIKSGYVLSFENPNRAILCRASFVGPARLTAELWRPEKLLVSDQEFQRDAGLLEGGMLALAIFILVTAVINRSVTYVVFAAWLVTALRIAAISEGWDTHWLGHTVPQDWVLSVRSLTRAAYAVLTVTLFKALFDDELKKLKHNLALNLLTWMSMGIVLGALVLSRKDFLPMMWALGGTALLLLSGLLISLVRQANSRVAIWYGASLAITSLSGLSEIIAAAFGITVTIGWINSVTAALASSLLASIAIAAQMRKEHLQRLAAQAELQHNYDAMPIGLFTLDLQGRFISTNPALRKNLGNRGFGEKHNSWQQYFGADIWLQLYQMVNQQEHGELEIQSQMDVTGKATPRRFLIKATLANDKIEGSLQDVTEKSLATEELNFLANHDSLTKVLNRRGLEQVFNSTVARIDNDHPMAMAYLDLDRFKLINDLYGHNAGDEVLKQVCERISGMLSVSMRMGRVGGDEFVIVLPDTRIPLATVICRGIVDSIDNAPYRVGEKAFHVRGSMGLIEVRPGTLMKEALSTSDRACREAKAGQKKGLVVYEQDSPAFKEHEAEIRLIERLSSSETIEGLFVEMQPIMSLTRPNESLNFEVLLRMRDPVGKLIPVSRVIAAGEHSGRMSVIDRWVLSTTLAWLDQNRPRLQNTQFVCMNLSGASLNDEEFVQEVFDLLRRNSHVVSFLSIEITESVALHDLQNTRRFIDKVRRYGARVALDDFGAGYTSFSYLKDLPADLLKIDGSFVVNMNQHPANVSIVEAIVNLARNLGMKTIAEWAEDAATVQTLAEIGVDYVQGFIVARPMAPERIIEAKSAASFIQDAELLHFVKQMGRVDDAAAHADLILQDIQEIPRKIH